ncbi:MAG: proline dehydrogenase [Bacteroidetes bacterium]|nr:proline dehydrogenase [Bacteroidota bacterium]
MPSPSLPPSFDNTALAFNYKSDAALKKARFLFTVMSNPLLVLVGTRLVSWAIRMGLPVNGLIRSTLFSQFIGGETLEQTVPVAAKLNSFQVKVILDYAVEGKQGDHFYDQARDQFLRVIDFAATHPNIPFISIKLTGLARFELLEELNKRMVAIDKPLLARYELALNQLSPATLNEWGRVFSRIEKICFHATTKKIAVTLDAEETWIQEPLDALCAIQMELCNKKFPFVYNTYQLYRTDRLTFLQSMHELATSRGYITGAKLVRGAYMEKERKRAAEMGYASPINPTKEATDLLYDQTLRFCIDNLNQVGVIVASHNEESSLLAFNLLKEQGLPPDHPHIHWSQLYGMSDNITFNLAAAGCSVSKYLPFGPIEDVVPYLMRRAQENTSVKGQTGKELRLIQKELVRRAHSA